jgi:hypothetical protein
MQIADSLGRTDDKWDQGAALVWRASILAALGKTRDAVAALRQAEQKAPDKFEWRAMRGLRPLRGLAEFEALVASR